MSEVRTYKNKQLLYHVTAFDNLESIFRNGILSREEIRDRGLLKADVADSEIIRKRSELGILQYVPFHFFEKTPFTDFIFKRYIHTTFCTIAIRRNLAQSKNFKIATRHPLSPKVEILPYEDGMKKIDWDTMGRRNYADEECKNICMAECLATSPVLPDDFYCIFVPDRIVKNEVELLADRVLETGRKFFVSVNPGISSRAVIE